MDVYEMNPASLPPEPAAPVFRRMRQGDAPQIAKLEQLCFRTPWTEKMLRQELKNPVSHYHVLENASSIIAYAGMWVYFDEAHITNVAVHPQFRRRGLGNAIMLSSMQAAMALGAKKMTLEVRESNLGAQELYWKLGFEPAGRRKKYYSDTGEDALILWNKDISETVNQALQRGAWLHP